jgi:hypothetical protein
MDIERLRADSRALSGSATPMVKSCLPFQPDEDEGKISFQVSRCQTPACSRVELLRQVTLGPSAGVEESKLKVITKWLTVSPSGVESLNVAFWTRIRLQHTQEVPAPVVRTRLTNGLPLSDHESVRWMPKTMKGFPARLWDPTRVLLPGC